MLDFVVAWLSFLLAYPAMRTIVRTAGQLDRWVARVFLACVAVLAVAIVVLGLPIRMHPERWVARRIDVPGIGVAVASMFAQAMTLWLSGLPAWSFLS